MKVTDLKQTIAELNQQNQSFDMQIWDYKANLESRIFQTIAATKCSCKKEIIESLLENADLAIEKRIEDLTKFKTSLVNELNILILKNRS